MVCVACLRAKKSNLCKLMFLMCLCTLIVLSVLLRGWSRREASLRHENYAMQLAILPALPVVPEGTSTQIVCLVSDDAQVYLETPSLPASLRASVRTSSHVGGVVLTIERVAAGHSGVYTCHATGRMGVERTQSMELKVMAGDGGTSSEVITSLSSTNSVYSDTLSPTSHKSTSSPASQGTALPSHPSQDTALSNPLRSTASLPTSHSSHSTTPPPSSHTSQQTSSSPTYSSQTTTPPSTSSQTTNPSSTSHSSQITTPPSTSYSPQSTAPPLTSRSSPIPLSSYSLRDAPSSPTSHMPPISTTPSSLSKDLFKTTLGINNKPVASTDTMSSTPGASIADLASFDQKGKTQMANVDEFCQKHNLQYLKYSVPKGNSAREYRYAFNRHMMLDDQHEVLFCFVPKVGCTNLKLLFFVTQGVIPRSELSKSRDHVNQVALEWAINKHSFISKDSSTKEAVLKSYFKFAMFRNPLERLASSYRSKIERFKLVGTKDQSPPFNWLRKAIFKHTHPQLYSKWAKNKGNTSVSIEFCDFIDYWLVSENPEFKFDEHFLLITDICQPCRTRFDFYGNFNHFEHDAQLLISKIGANSTDLRSGYYNEDTSTETRMQQYYSTLSEGQKRQMLKKMALDLEFYYTVFPEEKDRHKKILGISDDLPQV